MQACTLNPNQAVPEQVIMATPRNLYVLQEPRDAALDDVLVAERSADDLLLAFRSQEQAHQALKFEQFFANNGNLHVLRQDGELLRIIASQDNPQQGSLSFDLQPASTAEHQTAAPILNVLQQALFPIASEVEPQVAALSAPVQVAAMGIAPLLSTPPQITQAFDQLGSKQGALRDNDVTDDRYFSVLGTGTPGAYLEILDKGEIIAEIQVDSNGNWRFEPDEAFAEGAHVLTVREQGSSETSGTFTLLVDTLAPSRVFIDSISTDAAGTQIIERNGHTADNTPVIKGRAEPSTMVIIYAGKSVIATTFADNSGKWEFSSPFILPDGTYTISASAMDFSGNVGLSSTSYTITIDTIPPAVPTIEQALDDVGALQGPLASGALTDDRTPTLAGHAEPGVTIYVYGDGDLLGTTKADANGNWSFTPPVALSDGEHIFTAIAHDLAGNTSTPSGEFKLEFGADRTQAPTIEAVIDDVGSVVGALVNGSLTDDTTPTLRGKAQVGDTVRIYDNDVLIGESLVDAQGNWSFTPEPALAEGPHSFQVQGVNHSQSPSERSPVFELVIDITPPDASRLSITSIYDDVGSVTGNVAHYGRTDDQNPQVNGIGTAGETIIVYVQDLTGKREVGRAQVGSDGKWSLEVSTALAYGKHSFTAVQVDAAGNATAPSPAYIITIGNDSIGGFDIDASETSSQQINTTIRGEQSNPQVTRLANGNLVVVWQQDTDNGYDYNTMMQLMDPTGTKKIGLERLVNQRTAWSHESPQVTALADGGFVVVWESNLGVSARHYNGAGVAQGDEFLVNQTPDSGHRAPGALSLPDGSYIISWYSSQSKGSIMQRTYDANDQPVGDEVMVQSGGVVTYRSNGPEMALFEDPAHSGWYITVWTGTGSNNTNDVFGQLRKADGSMVGDIMALNITVDAAQNHPDVIVLKDGSFVVFWDSSRPNNNFVTDIYAAHYSFNPATGATSLIGDGDFIVNQNRISQQSRPVGVALDDGGYILIWGSSDGDGSGSAIFGQRFDANSNKVGHEFLVNPITQGNQAAGWDKTQLGHMLDAVLLENGDIFVTWQSDNIDGDGLGIEGVVINADAAFYSEFVVNPLPTYALGSASAALPDGGFVVVSTDSRFGLNEPFGQLYDATGMPVGEEIRIATTAPKWGSTIIPDVVTFPDGTFLVAWNCPVFTSGYTLPTSIRAQRFGYTYDSAGNISGSVPIGEELLISPKGYQYNENPNITLLDDGGYMIVWQTNKNILQLDQPWQVMACQYDASGNVVGSEVVVGSVGLNRGVPSETTITTLGDGRVAISYAKVMSSSDSDVYFRVYDPKTLSYSEEICANQVKSGQQGMPSITALANGNFVVVWDSSNSGGLDQSSSSIWARIYSSDGTALGNEFLANAYTLGAQKAPIVVAHPGGGFVVLYSSEGDRALGADKMGIYAQFFDDAGQRVGHELRINQMNDYGNSVSDATFLEDGRLFVNWTGSDTENFYATKGRIIDLDRSVGLQDHVSPYPLANLGEAPDHGNLWMLFDDGSASGLMLSGESLSSVHGGNGNDVIGIRDTSFSSINGGDGFDTLLIDGKNLSVDIDSLVARITGIEKIDLGRGSSNSLTLSADTLEHLGMSDMVQADGKNQLVINGDASNSIQLKDTLSESWTDAGQTEVGGVLYHTYVSGSNELLVEQNIHVTVL